MEMSNERPEGRSKAGQRSSTWCCHDRAALTDRDGETRNPDRDHGSRCSVICKRPALPAFHTPVTPEIVCPLTGKLRGTRDERYGTFRS